MREIDERDLQHGFADMEQSVLDKQRETITALQAKNEELEHIIKDLLTRNMNLVAELFSLQSKLAECDKTVLEQQAVIKGLRECVYMLDKQYLESRIYNCNLSALEAHDREIRIKCLEDALAAFRGKSMCDGFAEIHRRVDELKEHQ